MHIRIEAAALLLRSAGVKNFVYYWLAHLRANARGHKITAFPFETRVGNLDHERSVAGRAATLAGIARLHLSNNFPWRDRADVFHHSSQALRRPPRGPRITATLHDLTCWITPELHAAANVHAAKAFANAVIRRADGLIADSHNTRRDAIEILGLAPEKICVIYPGVPGEFFEATAQHAAAARARLGLTRPYILFVGTVEPRKNLPKLLEAYAAMSPAARREFELVIAGPVGWADEDTVARLRSPAAGVRYLGYVAERDLPGLTAGAIALAYPSLYEGFGFPAAQAMAAGVPVVTSNVSCLPEIAGDAAVLVDPRDAREIAVALERVLGNSDLRTRLAAAGRRRAEAFRWSECARSSIDFFEKIAGGN